MTTADRFKKINKTAKEKTEKVKENGLGSVLTRTKGPVADKVPENRESVPLDVSGACRGSVYTPPSLIQQTFVVFTTQMKRFCRDKAFVMLIALVVLVPIGVFVMEPLELVHSDVSNTFMATALMLAPVICSLVAAMTCGSMIPQEFNERTAFMSLPLPMTRLAFCLGKFLAGLSLALAVVLAAYGLAIVSSAAVADVTYAGSIGSSVLVAVMTMFSYCCITFLVSVFAKRSGTMLSLLLLAGILPAIFIALGFVLPLDAFGYLPFFGFDLSVMHLGMPAFGSVASIIGFLGSNAPFAVGSSVGIMSAVSVVVGILCFAAAVYKVQRRDM